MFPLRPKLLTFMTNFFYLNFSISTIMSSRKYPSGSEKRKKRKQADVFIETQRGDLDKFFRTNSSTSRNPNELALAIVPVEEHPNINLRDPEGHADF